MKTQENRVIIDPATHEVICTLVSGYRLRFWEKGLSSDQEYIRRTREMEILENYRVRSKKLK